jgi:hypothetical protein
MRNGHAGSVTTRAWPLGCSAPSNVDGVPGASATVSRDAQRATASRVDGTAAAAAPPCVCAAPCGGRHSRSSASAPRLRERAKLRARAGVVDRRRCEMGGGAHDRRQWRADWQRRQKSARMQQRADAREFRGCPRGPRSHVAMPARWRQGCSTAIATDLAIIALKGQGRVQTSCFEGRAARERLWGRV